MWDLIVLIPYHCISIYLNWVYMRIILTAYNIKLVFIMNILQKKNINRKKKMTLKK